jgi:hypothetical protein
MSIQYSVLSLPTKDKGAADVVVVSAAMASPVIQSDHNGFSK